MKLFRSLLGGIIFAASLVTALAQPANDNFADRTIINGTSISFAGTTALATKEIGEPVHAGNTGGKSVWYQWTPTVTANVTITSDGNGFRTLLAAYTGDAVDNLGTAVASGAEPNFGGAATMTFTASAGVAYKIVVDTRNNVAGNTFAFTLNQPTQPTVTLTAPANGQTFTNPTPITLSASATAIVGTVTNVSFFHSGNVLIGSDTTSPYSITWSNMAPGTYTIVARATDSTGQIGASAGRSVTVFPFGYFSVSLIGSNNFTGTNSWWRYLDNGTDQGTAWQAWGFDDSTWAAGPGELGYGDGDEATVVEDDATPGSPTAGSTTRYITTYFRHSFTVANVASITNLVARCLVDDGAVLYLNGIEVFRSNLPEGQNYLTLAPNAPNEPIPFISTNINPALLTNGVNVLAAEVHQNAGNSSDLSWYLELTGSGANGNNPPAVAITSPANGGLFPPGTNITITVNATDSDGTVTNVAFYVGAAKLGDDSVAPYSFTWTNVAQGIYTLTAVATDEDGGSANSAGVNITVNNYTIVPVSLVPTGSVWKYFDKGVDQGTAWKEFAFDDSGWSNGVAELGYGDSTDTPSKPEATVVGYGPDANNKYITTYFRRPFVVTNAAAITNLIINLMRDDGAVVYINGAEIRRDNLPLPPTVIEYSTLGTVVSGTDEHAFFSSTNTAFLNNGTNIIAVEVHQNAVTSSDLSFELELIANSLQGLAFTNYATPFVQSQNPSAGSTVSSLTSVQVLFNESVSGVNATDLLVNGVPASGISGSANLYTFTFPQPAAGTVNFTWAIGHGIQDQDLSPLPFDGAASSNTWSYNLVDLAPPTIIARVPASGATVTNLTSVQVTFSESVIGVDASDFLVNGTPATGISGAGATRTFTFAQPGFGAVNISWAVVHGITDPSGNPFNATGAGATWSYTLQGPTVFLATTNAIYRYFKGTSEASTPTTLWRTNDFDDSTWLTGAAPIGYDDDPSGVNYAPFGTLLTDMRNNYISVFQRRAFNLSGAAALTNVVLRHRVDDGIIVWLNGIEIFRTTSMGVTGTEYAFNTLANNNPDQANYTTVALPATVNALLREGTNVVAIQSHNSSSGSSDLIGSVELTATLLDPLALPPAISTLTPLAGDVFVLTNITIQFTEAVQGVNASDLLINGIAATGLTGSSNLWTWTFAQPNYGPVNVTFAGAHGITDFDAPPKAFISSGFSYNLVNPSAPTIAGQTPLAGTEVGTLTQVQINFSENVQGVNAADLLVNGAPATGISGSGASYTFTFAQPAYGNVQITWAVGHAITDTEPAQNAFDPTRPGATWSYTLTDLTPPTVATQNPVAGANVTNLTQLTVTFTEAVLGVNASDLLINNVAATGVSGGPTTFTFTFAQPNTSIVLVNWVGTHGITDSAPAPNAFDATGPGATWQYQTPDNVAPTVATINPPNGATVRDFTQLAITFAEPVTGVSASDLRINTVPATQVTGSGAGPYTFNFTQPVTGAVEVVWAAGHGVTDLAVPPNPFAGGEYNYVLNPNAVFANKIVLNEIMFHPSTENTNHEWLELHNTDSAPVNLTGWQFTKGINFTFPNVTIPAGGYLVVAANVEAFQAKHPTVPNVVGGWIGRLSNSDEEIELETVTGEEVDLVHYASEGDWAIRQRGPQDVANANNLLNRGWKWFSAADGLTLNTATGLIEGGRSLELRNPALPNEHGQNWFPSTQTNGTPGAINTQLTNNIPPMILNVAHFPIVPTSADTVTVTARILDEVTNGHSVVLFRRDHTTTSPAAFAGQTMFDDGAHNDGLPGDGIYGAIVPVQANLTIIEYYVRAIAQGRTNFWPAPARQLDGSFAQTANALYQVDNEAFTTNMPLYRIIMTASESFEYFNQLNQNSDAEMNATFISMDGEGTKLRHRSGLRIRGAGSRGGTPKNNRVNIATDNRWNGLNELNLNNRYTHAQTIGSALSLKAGLPASSARPVQYRINAVNLASAGNPQYGAYVFVEPINGDWAENHYPNDGDGNGYRGSRAPWTANLDFQGSNSQTYVNLGYSKVSNQSDNDWSDLFALTYALTQVPADVDYVPAVLARVNVTNWMRYFAVSSLMSYQETSLCRGVGDDYAMYRGVADSRFTLVPHDFDTILNQGDTAGVIGESIFQPILSPESSDPSQRANFLQRFMRHPQFVPIYFAELKHLGETVFAPTNLNPLVDQVLGDWAASATIPAIKSFNASRSANVLSQIPLTYSVTHTLALSNGVPRSTTATITLRGSANAIDTRNVRVSGINSTYSAWEGRWTNSTVTLQPGFNNLLIEFVGVSSNVFSTNLLVWYDTGAFNDVTGAIAGNTVWTPGAGPYRLTGSITVNSGATLTIQAGTTVYLNSGVNLNVANGGRLLAEGTPTAGIRFLSTPGSGARWGGIVINGAGSSPESRITYAHVEGNNNTAIDLNGGAAVIDYVTFGTTDRRYLDLDAASFVVSHCVFPTATAALEPVHGAGGIRAGGRGIILRNFFGKTIGYNDTIDFTGGNRPGPILQIIDNVFTGSDDDILDLDGTDAWVQGNIFLHAHRLGSPDSASAVSGGSDSGSTSEITVIGNIFYDVDQAAMAKQGNFYNFINNTVVRQNSAGFDDAGRGAVLAFADDTYAVALGMYAEGNIFHDIERLTRDLTNATPPFNATTFNNNLMPLAWAGAGTNNSTANPLLTYVPQLSETTNFNSWQAAQVLRSWFALQPASPGIGSGPNGQDKGGLIPWGVSISGEPAGTNSQTTATLRVGPLRTGNSIPAGANAFPSGSGYTHYRWRLNLGPWSAETVASNPINLSSLSGGAHRVDVVGRLDSGLYQDDTNFNPLAAVTASRSWFVNTTLKPVRLSEVLAANSGVLLHSGTTPDAIELQNLSGTPVDLSGYRLTDDASNPDRYTFPDGATIPANGYLVVYADDEATPGLHTGFSLSADGEGLFLYDRVENGGALIDSVSFGLQLDNLSIGRIADGSWNLCVPSFGAANVAAPLGDPRRLRINEWLAIGLTLSPEDFIELYNFDSLPVALGGLYLSDEPTGWPNQHAIAPLSFIGGGGYRSFIADGNDDSGAEHLNFSLSPEQGVLSLANRDLSIIDIVVYLSQRVDVSQGRSPNGSSNVVYFALPTPGAPNPSALNTNSGVVINEVLANNQSLPEPDGTTPDWIEFHNLSGVPVDIGDMSVTDSTLTPRRYVFAPGTSIGALGYLRLRCDPDLPASGTNSGFGLKSSGGAVYLFDKPANGGGLVNAVVHGLQAADFSIGRVPNGTGGFALTVPTPEAVNNAATLGNVSLVKINEWMAVPTSGDDWFELYNPNAQPVAIGGMFLTDTLANRTKSPIPALSFLGGGGTNGWQRFWADNNPAAGADHVAFALNSEGETIGFSASASVLIDSTSGVGQQTAGVSEGRFPDGNPSTSYTKFPVTPSPGAANYLSLSNVVINEALAHTDLPLEDAIELRNITGTNVNIGNWWLSDARTTLRKYRIPNGTIIPANGYVVFYEYQFNADTNDPTSFSLSSANGDEVYLSAADTNGVLTGFRSVVDFGASRNGVSFGRYVTSDANEEFTAMSARSFGPGEPGSVAQFRTNTGMANPYPLVGPVVIKQIQYHPPDDGTNDNTLDEFIELRNITGSAVPMYDPAATTNVWRLRDAVDFDFPPGVTIPAQSNVVLVSFDPVASPGQLASFRALYGLPSTVPVYGPYLGRLSNGDDKVELYRPDAPNAGSVPYVLVDRVHYYDAAPWPQAADGSGFSINRVSLTGYANDPTNWFAALPDFGSGNPDTDGDGMPNAYENQYAPTLNPNVPDGGADPDGDGMTNLEEYQAGTNPTQASSALRIISIESTGPGTVRLSFLAVSNRSYRLLFKNALQDPAWNTLTNISSAPTNRLLFINTTSAIPMRYYRLELTSSGFASLQDTDGDGMPNEWELVYGFNTNSLADANLDTDGDGLSNLQEYWADTNPTNAASVLKLSSIESLGGNQVRLTFSAVSNKSYTIEFKNSFSDAAWSNVASVAAVATNRVVQVSATVPALASRLFRLRTG
jgi:hypothetical protein